MKQGIIETVSSALCAIVSFSAVLCGAGVKIDGGLSIVTDPSPENQTEIPEKRHSNNAGYFDDSSSLHIRRGKIISGGMKGFYGKPVKQVQFITEDGSVDYTAEVEVIWSDILYGEGKTGSI